MENRCCPSCRRPVPAGASRCPYCSRGDRTQALTAASATEAQSPLGPAAGPLPGRMGQYRIVRELGRGGMGRVLEAVDEPLGRRVAVKVLLAPGEKEVRRRRFVEEARVTGCLEHPGIAPVYNLGKNADGTDYFSMKLVAGRTLGDILKDLEAGQRQMQSQYPLARLLSIFERVVETIAYAHSRGILHRDLKPANIMIGEHGEVWVLDWGLAKVIGQRDEPREAGPVPVGPHQDLTVPGHVVGTPQYMASEQAKSLPLDQRTDVFGLGGILYRILTGQTPHQGTDYVGTLMQAALGELVPVRNTPLGRHAPRALAAIAEKCLASQPEARYATANLLLADLRAYAAGEAIQALPDGLAGKLFRLARKHRQAAGLFAAALTLLLVGWTVAATIIAALDRRALEAERQLAESAARAQRRLQAFPPYAEATDLLMRGQLYDRAAELLEEALKIDPEFPEARFALGEALRQAGQPGPAAQAYLKANDLSRQLTGRPHLQALLAAGMAFDGAGDYNRSEQAFQQAEQAGAGHPLALVGKAFRLAHEQRFAEARAAAEESLRLGPQFWETHMAAGYVLEEMAEHGLLPPEPTRRQAIAHLRKAQELAPRQAETLVWLGRSLLRSGNRSEGLRLFDQAIALEPRNGNRHIARGIVRQSLGDGQGADADFRKARELGASRSLVLFADSLMAERRGDIETAFRLIGEAIQESRSWPPHVGNWLILGFRLQRDAQIQDRYEEWCRQNPYYPEVYALRAQLRSRAGDFPAAVAEDQAGLKIAPYNRKLRTQLALHLANTRNWKEALAAADSALELLPGEFMPLLVKARCLGQLGRAGEARAILDRLAKEYPARAREIDEVRKGLPAPKA